MAIEHERSVILQDGRRAEMRLYVTGVDTDEPLPVSHNAPNVLIEPVYFWFTFTGTRYRALAFVRLVAT